VKRLIIGIGLTAAVLLGANAAGTHAATPSRYTQLVRATNTFGYWFTYYSRLSTAAPGKRLPPKYVNAQVERYIIPTYPHRPGSAISGQIVGDLRLGNIPNGYRFHIDSFSSTHAVETVHWLFGHNPHTPIDRLFWTYTPSGWKISAAHFVRTS
jgi:hypothetical protein